MHAAMAALLAVRTVERASRSAHGARLRLRQVPGKTAAAAGAPRCYSPLRLGGGGCPPQGDTMGSAGGVGSGCRSSSTKTPSERRCSLSHGSVMRVFPSWLPSVVQPLCTLCGRPKSSSLREPGANRSSRSYISSGLRLVSRTSAHTTSQSMLLLICGLPLIPIRQCSLEWLIQG